jgi:hypothetical protein
MTSSYSLQSQAVETSWNQALDEIRLIFMESRDHLDIIRRAGKRSKEEIALKEIRLALLKDAGAIFAKCVAHQAQIEALFRESE